MTQMLLPTTKFEPKAAMRGLQPQAVSVKIALRHRQMTQMLLPTTKFEPKAAMRDLQPQAVSVKIALRHR